MEILAIIFCIIFVAVMLKIVFGKDDNAGLD